jgi:mevalonate kinase
VRYKNTTHLEHTLQRSNIRSNTNKIKQKNYTLRQGSVGHAMNGSYANGAPQAMNGNGNGVLKENNHANGHTTRLQSKHVTVVEPSTPSANGTRRIPMHDRKLSNPLAPPFLVSAPGKTIVYGEHAVVHGKAAIAAAISLRSYMLVTTLSKSKRTVSLKFSDIGLDHTWNINELPWKAFSHPLKKKRYYDMVTSLDTELVEAMQPHITKVSPDAPSEARKIHMLAASSFLYLFLSLGSENSPACVYALRSAIPIAAGLGSSASISVCISAALLIQSRALSGPHPDQMSHEAEEQLERINRWAFVGELAIHGTPSGVDNTVATNGRAVLFQRKDYSKPPMVKILRDFPELPLLLVNTLQPKSTSAEVAKVARMKERHPAVAESILDGIDAITRSVHDCISHEDFDASNPDSIAYLGELMSVNHGLLTALGVSHPKLERLRYLVDQAGVGWTKLTGAGGGGCAITLLKPTTPSSAQQLNGEAAHEPPLVEKKATPTMETLLDQLEDEGFERYKITLGGDGVGVLYPAIINDEEIHQDMFLTTEGREGVEALVSGRNDPEAWKYWRP